MAVNLLATPITMDDLPYLCDFENDTENASWMLNPSIDLISTNNHWYIGKATAYTGHHSLYVSNQNGDSCFYDNTNNVLIAYRDITLDEGKYDIAYDWVGIGNKTNGYLKVVYANRPTSSIKCLGNSVEPTWVATAVQLMSTNTSLNDADAWRHVQARVEIPKAQANKTTTRLFFIWVNNEAKVTHENTSIAIDNFQLAKAAPNDDYPTNIHVTTSLGTSVISWEGNADSYEVLYRKKTDDDFASVIATNNTITLKDVEYGAYEFWICGINDGEKTLYTVFPLIYVYETDCFDALNMYNASFEYGKWQHSSGKAIEGLERIDYGCQDIRSRQTTHFDTTEIDPRTIVRNGCDTIHCLKTVPKGEFGSIRLGNWNTGSEYESITFKYNVESNASAVLIIHYAMVLENPNHTANEQPRFTLDVFDEQNQPIDIKCASVDFHAPTEAEWADLKIRGIWHESDWQGRRFNWQDWQTIGISLEEYIGTTLTITLTSYDCDQGGHCGYAYFMLNCSRSDVDGLPWGEGSTTQKFTAPNGFNYAWFNRTDVTFSDTLSTLREFFVQESDTNTYICHVTYPTNSECGFNFDASAKPHHPLAEMAWKWVPENCVNGFRYWNRCHVGLTNQQTGEVEHRYDKQIENCSITLPNGDEQAFLYVDEGYFVPVPDEGGDYHFVVRTGVYVNDSLFADTIEYDIHIDAIMPVETHFYDSICVGGEVEFPRGSFIYRNEPGDYVDSLNSLVTGCDSTVFLHLYRHENRDTIIYDTLCVNGHYEFGSQILTNPGEYYRITPSIETGCDSMITLRLAQALHPIFTISSEIICAGENVELIAEDALMVDSLVIQWIGNQQTHQMVYNIQEPLIIPANQLQPGEYRMSIRSYFSDCNELCDTLEFSVRLSSSVVEARFEDLLVLLNENYNGGYKYATYEWYRNGELIKDATQSYYLLPDTAAKDDVYTLRVVLTDGTGLWVCPFTFEQLLHSDIENVCADEVYNRKELRNGVVYIHVGDKCYNLLGQEIDK